MPTDEIKDVGNAAVNLAHEIGDPIIIAFLLVIIFLISVIWMLLRSKAKSDNLYVEILAKKDEQLFGLAREQLAFGGTFVEFTKIFNKLLPENIRRKSTTKRKVEQEENGNGGE